MNVRERAKEYEAFMSSTGGSSPKSGRSDERKKSREELIDIESQGARTASGDDRKISAGEKVKPLPPPRKTKRNAVSKPEGSSLQQKKVVTKGKSSPEVRPRQPSSKLRNSADHEKGKAKQVPPPRPAPYKTPTMLTRAGTSPTSHKRLASFPTSVSKVRVSPQERGNTDSIPKSKKPPPPPNRTSSLPRKQRPPVPPKPKPVFQSTQMSKKYATLPKVGPSGTKNNGESVNLNGVQTEKDDTRVESPAEDQEMPPSSVNKADVLANGKDFEVQISSVILSSDKAHTDNQLDSGEENLGSSKCGDQELAFNKKPNNGDGDKLCSDTKAEDSESTTEDSSIQCTKDVDISEPISNGVSEYLMEKDISQNEKVVPLSETHIKDNEATEASRTSEERTELLGNAENDVVNQVENTYIEASSDNHVASVNTGEAHSENDTNRIEREGGNIVCGDVEQDRNEEGKVKGTEISDTSEVQDSTPDEDEGMSCIDDNVEVLQEQDITKESEFETKATDVEMEEFENKQEGVDIMVEVETNVANVINNSEILFNFNTIRDVENDLKNDTEVEDVAEEDSILKGRPMGNDGDGEEELESKKFKDDTSTIGGKTEVSETNLSDTSTEDAKEVKVEMSCEQQKIVDDVMDERKDEVPGEETLEEHKSMELEDVPEAIENVKLPEDVEGKEDVIKDEHSEDISSVILEHKDDDACICPDREIVQVVDNEVAVLVDAEESVVKVQQTSMSREEIVKQLETTTVKLHEPSNEETPAQSVFIYENVLLSTASEKEETEKGEITEEVEMTEEDHISPEPVRPARIKRELKKQKQNVYENVDLIVDEERTGADSVVEASQDILPEVLNGRPLLPPLTNINSYDNFVLSPSPNHSRKEAKGDVVESVEVTPREEHRDDLSQVTCGTQQDETKTGNGAAFTDEQIYVVPNAVCKALPRSEESALITDSEYHVPKTLMTETTRETEYGVPRTVSEQADNTKTEATEREKSRGRYENVEISLKEECTMQKDKMDSHLDINEVPRPQSFHSDSKVADEVTNPRSTSVDSLDPKAHSGYKASELQATSTDEQVYVVPNTVRKALPVTEESTPITDSEYHAPRTLMEESTEMEYKVPNDMIQASVVVGISSTREQCIDEDVYAVPAPGTPVAATPSDKSVQASSATEISQKREEFISDDVYAVPRSPSPPPAEHVSEKFQVNEKVLSEDVYAVPGTSVSPVSDDPVYASPKEEDTYSAPRRSSVITSRTQLPSSFKKGAPPKPPRVRASTEYEKDIIEEKVVAKDMGQSEPSSLPTPKRRNMSGEVKKTPEVKPRASPRTQPRQSQNTSTVEAKEQEPVTVSTNDKKETSESPTPKRAAPPRPRAPTRDHVTESTVDVKSPDTEEGAKKQKIAAPPRPPPPSKVVKRTSMTEAEQGDSSDSDSDVEGQDVKHVQPTGPPKKKTYHITHEILSTERTFVEALTLAYEDCYCTIKKAEVVPESTLNEIFKDLGNICQLDCKFLQELEDRMKTWDEHERIGDIIKKYGHFLKMYTTYINNYDKAMNVFQETMRENTQFAELVHHFQANKKCRGLMLVSFMLKPVQRIPSYRLLLIDYLKHLSQDSEEYRDIKVALDIVSEVATHINESMKKVDNFEQVLRIQGSIVGHSEIVKPGREFIKQGVLMKLCRKDMQERMFFLLTDVLLYTAPVGGNQYKLKETLPLLSMKVTLPESQDFENEFSIISTMRSFTLSASTPVERDEWIEELENSISAVAKKKISFFQSKDGTLATPEVEKESKLGDKAPVWIPDVRVTMCMLCTEKFTVTNRRHHCRGCGKVICGSCSDTLAPLVYLDYAQARVCEACYDVLLKEQNRDIITIEPEVKPLPSLADTDSLDRIHRKPPKFEILHRFKPANRRHHRRSKMFRPAVCTEVVGNESGSQVSGYLRCKRPGKHGWKRLWFVLKDNVVYTYKASEDVVAQETIPVLGYEVEESKKDGDDIIFELRHAGLPPILFKTDSESSSVRWTQELKKATKL